MSIRDDINAAVAQVASTYGAEYVKVIKQNLSKKDKLATGALYNSINYNVSIEDTGVALQLLYLDYLQWVNSGRKPGTMPPVSVIEEWIKVRGIGKAALVRRNIIGKFSKGIKILQGRDRGGKFTSLSKERNKLAWKIAYGIKKNGIKPTPVIDDAAAKLYSPMQEAALEAAVDVAMKHLDENFALDLIDQGVTITTTY